MNDNERPTPLTEALRIKIITDPTMDGGDRLVAVLNHARTLERSLAKRTEERDKLLEEQSWLIAHPTAIEAAHQVVEWTKCEQDRDTALAKLAKCRDALKQIAESGRGNTVWAETRPAQIARQTLEETK